MKPKEQLTAAADSSPATWSPLLRLATQEVFEVMLGCLVELRNPAAPAGFELTAMVGFAGQLCGRFSLRSSKESAAGMAGKILGTQVNNDDAQIWDAMGEIANMIAGNFKNKLVGLENRCALSLPTVISGSDYKCRAMKNSCLLEVALLFEGAPFSVTVEVQG
jgi:chemotaxis protein CheX